MCIMKIKITANVGQIAIISRKSGITNWQMPPFPLHKNVKFRIKPILSVY